jgi:hypothetical protein
MSRCRYKVHTGPGPFCILSGNETSLGVDVPKQLYGAADKYVREFTASLDDTIKAGYLLEVDRQQIFDTHGPLADRAFTTG